MKKTFTIGVLIALFAAGGLAAAPAAAQANSHPEVQEMSQEDQLRQQLIQLLMQMIEQLQAQIAEIKEEQNVQEKGDDVEISVDDEQIEVGETVTFTIAYPENTDKIEIVTHCAGGLEISQKGAGLCGESKATLGTDGYGTQRSWSVRVDAMEKAKGSLGIDVEAFNENGNEIATEGTEWLVDVVSQSDNVQISVSDKDIEVGDTATFHLTYPEHTERLEITTHCSSAMQIQVKGGGDCNETTGVTASSVINDTEWEWPVQVDFMEKSAGEIGITVEALDENGGTLDISGSEGMVDVEGVEETETPRPQELKDDLEAVIRDNQTFFMTPDDSPKLDFDVSGDGKVDATDQIQVRNMFEASRSEFDRIADVLAEAIGNRGSGFSDEVSDERLDINNDGRINAHDVNALVNVLGDGWENTDRSPTPTELKDDLFNVVADNFADFTTPDDSPKLDFDLNGDGFVDGTDLAMVRDMFAADQEEFDQIVDTFAEAIGNRGSGFSDDVSDDRLDINKDGRINAHDVNALANILGDGR